MSILLGPLDVEDSGVQLFNESDVSFLGCFTFILAFKNNFLARNFVTYRRSQWVNDDKFYLYKYKYVDLCFVSY